MATNLLYLPVTILSGASLSAPVNLGQARLAAILFPAAWTAAALTFDAGPDIDPDSLKPLIDATDAEYSITVTVGRVRLVTIADFLSLPALRLRSGTQALPVSQGADRVLGLLLVP